MLGGVDPSQWLLTRAERGNPSTVLDDDSRELFTAAPDDWALERWIAQLAWTVTLGREGGLFFSIGRRRT